MALFILQNSSREETITQQNKPKIAATIFPIYDIAKNIVGDNAEVILLIPSGSSPHSYSLTPGQIAGIRQAQALFAIGHGLDNSIVKSVANIADISVTNVDQQIQLHTYSEEKKLPGTTANLIDPHYWLTVPNAKQIAITISNQMQTIDPANNEEYKQNLASYLDQLDSLENELQALSQQVTQPSIITVHNSWSYFAEQYRLQTAGSYEPLEGREPSLKDIQRLQQTIKQHKITTFFTEPQKPISTATKLFKDEFGLNIAVLDPIGGGEEGGSYIKSMRRNMQAILNAEWVILFTL